VSHRRNTPATVSLPLQAEIPLVGMYQDSLSGRPLTPLAYDEVTHNAAVNVNGVREKVIE
jgi:hypothetical protein